MRYQSSSVGQIPIYPRPASSVDLMFCVAASHRRRSNHPNKSHTRFRAGPSSRVIDLTSLVPLGMLSWCTGHPPWRRRGLEPDGVLLPDSILPRPPTLDPRIQVVERRLRLTPDD